MCLITKQRVAKFATEDIPVYKMVKVISPKRIMSPFYEHFRWEVGKIHRVFYWPWNIFRPRNRGDNVSYVDYSFHAFLRSDLCRPGYEQYDAIVPKGSWYFISDDGSEIASNRLKLIKPHVQL